MGFIAGIWMAVLGVLAAARLIIGSKPQLRPLIDKLLPYQGWIGAVSALWGVWEIIWCVLNLGWLTLVPLFWVTMLITGLLQASLGLLLGIGVLKTFIKHPQAVAKMDQTMARLVPFQATLGVLAIGFGLWGVVAAIIF